MELLTTDQGDVHIIHIHGRLMKHSEADDFRAIVDAAIKDGFKKIIVDIGQVDWMNSTGLGMLVRAYVALNAQSIPMRIAGASESVRTVMNVNKLDKVFGLFPTVADAMQSLK